MGMRATVTTVEQIVSFPVSCPEEKERAPQLP
jgi:hypothetical protein